MKSILIAILFALVSASAFAEPAFIDPDNGLCALGPYGFTDDSRIVVTFDPDTCDMHLMCTGTHDVDLDGADVIEGVGCGISVESLGIFALTDAMHFVATPSGKAKLQCHVYDCSQITLLD
jgi:hypothetical protein